MPPLFRNVSLDQIEKFSPELMLGIESCLEEGHDNLRGILGSNSKAKVTMPSALVIGALEGQYMSASMDTWSSTLSEMPGDFGSLAAYAMAHAGNATALNMLEVITALPDLTQWKDPTRNVANESTISICQRFGAAACRFALSHEQGLKAIKDFHSSYVELLGLDGDGKQSFAISNNQSDFAIDSLVHAELRLRIMQESGKRKPLDAIDVLAYSGPLLVALTVTQPQIWIEQGHDPETVKDIIDRRVRGYWGMTKFDYKIVDELVDAAVQAAFMPFNGFKQITSANLWGIPLEICKKVGPAKTLDVVKYCPVATAGPMAMFKPIKPSSVTSIKDSMQFICQPDYASRMLGQPWQESVTRDTVNRAGAWVLGKHKDVWPLASCADFRRGLTDWHLQSTQRSPRHPLVPAWLHWEEFLIGDNWSEMCQRKILSKPGADHVHSFMKAFATNEPERFDALACQVLSDLRRAGSHRALMPHVSNKMKSIAFVSDTHRDRAFSSDLGL